MPKNRSHTDASEEYHEFIQLVAQQNKVLQSLKRAAALLDSPDVTLEQAQARRDFIDGRWKDLSARDEQLTMYEALPACATEAYFTEDFLGTCEELYLTTYAGLSAYIHAAMPRMSPASSTTEPDAAISEAHQRRTQVPKIKLPHFSGNFIGWIEFRDHFQALILNDASFDSFHRLYYLKSCLEGEAAALLKNLSITADNFEVAWKMLTERYENKRRLLSILLNELFGLKPVSREGSPGELRKLLDSAQECLDALAKLGRPISDDISVHIVTQRLDRDTREAWEFSLEGDGFATFDELERFLKLKIRSLEAATAGNKTTRSSASQPRTKATANPSPAASAHHASPKKSSNNCNVQCTLCNNTHPTYKCAQFTSKPVSQRWEVAREHTLCFNCLSARHTSDGCPSTRTCSHCHERHHTLLHSPPRKKTSTDAGTSASTSGGPLVDANLIQSHLSTLQVPTHIILTTAWVLVTAASHRVVKLRALLDPGSTHTFISRVAATELRTKTYPTSMRVNGIGLNRPSTVSQIVPISVSAVGSNEVALSTEALVLDNLTSYVPRFRYPVSHWPHLKGLELSDRNPTDDTPIHLVIGADLYAYALRDGLIRGRRDEPVALNTIFGWVLSGMSNTDGRQGDEPRVQVHHVHVQDDDLHSSLTRFWETEEIPASRTVSRDDAICERHFKKTHSRTADGRYVVRLPLRAAPALTLGNTYRRALQCLQSIERRLASRPSERIAYTDFMREYESLGHMRIATARPDDASVVYLPHHPIVKTSSTTTKTRIVFNASAISASGKSLNDLQYIGPKLQADLSLMHLQWRTYKFVYTADIEKMYRQILISPHDVDLQRILWRHTPSAAISEYQLLTVTYGTASAPFLALRVLQQLVTDEGHGFPRGKDVVRSHMFVDDVLFGADTIEEAIAIRIETTALLNKGHFTLRKWSSNSITLLSDIDPSNHGLSCDKALQDDDSLKILGIAWRPTDDSYCFTLNLSPLSIVTKRVMLSQIARIFDPLGWLAPVVVIAKHLIQLLWSCNVHWDAPVPEDLQSAWEAFYIALPSLAAISIPRWLDISPSSRIELHGFSDASMKAYAAVMYVRTESPSGVVSVHLLTAKTRIAPVKQLTIPRLELCGAVILARLATQVRSIPIFTDCPLQCWTDATIVLAWLRGQPNDWKTFVANRVAEVQTSLPKVSWRHVPGADNPADLASRGVSASELASSHTWWHGPSWLSFGPSSWPSVDPTLDDGAPLERKSNVHHANVQLNGDHQPFQCFSSWPRMCRVLAICLRFSAHWRSTVRGQSRIQELTCVANRIFCLCQATPFCREVALLKKNPKTDDGSRFLQRDQALPKSSPLRRLNPFLDADGLLRVGGRLSLSHMAYAAKFPIILLRGHVAVLLARHAHERCLHGGITLTLSTLRTHVWVLQGRKLVKSVVAHCVPCARQLAKVPAQMMGSLPSARINRPLRAFVECGVDYAGPVRMRFAGGRGSKSHLAYIALFVCMASRAVHLEVVSDYSADAFLAAFQRFTSRRGLPSVVHSDRGTNFQGANKELRAAFQAAIGSETLRARLLQDKVEWNFIPPAAPHSVGCGRPGCDP